MFKAAAASILIAASLTACAGSTAPKLSNAQIKAQVRQLVDDQSGTLLVIKGVDWCVEAVSDSEWECRVEVRNDGQGGVMVQETVFAKCDPTVCRLEE
jgi:uncharacterized protein